MNTFLRIFMFSSSVLSWICFYHSNKWYVALIFMLIAFINSSTFVMLSKTQSE